MENKLSRKERKAKAELKRSTYYLQIAKQAGVLAKPKGFIKTFAKDLDLWVHNLTKKHYLDAHIIRQAARQYARDFAKP